MFYQGMTATYELSVKQTKKWNEYYGFTPHIRQPKSTAQLQKEAENQLLREIQKWQTEYQKTSEKLVKVAKNIEECTYQLKLLKEGGV
jgi:histidinol phosphatase-like PHP family hydrolase